MYAALPRVPPLPMFKVAESDPCSVNELDTVRVLDVVPPAMLNPVVNAVGVIPLYVLPVSADAILLLAMAVAFQVPLPMVPTVVMLPDPVDGA